MLCGELDSSSAPTLAQTLAKLYRSTHPVIVADLSQVTFLGAATLSVLLNTYNLLCLDNRTLLLAHPSQAVYRILEITDLDAILPITSEIE